ncbi:AzlD domain-containing protein [Billgrantia saliphila]|uniref:AzlD domain-containing protein n=1 Tax=Billgrantia saliphila TaxID=1848458 RepID=UPI000CE52514|nr:AzlD domain-containing protein [Halomonas saliphila]
MSSALWLAVLATAAGTLLMRILPLLWMRHRLERRERDDDFDAMPQWLGILGPVLIAAVLGSSLVPSPSILLYWSATACGVAITLLVWWRLRSLGWPVAAGVSAYGLVIIILGL